MSFFSALAAKLGLRSRRADTTFADPRDILFSTPTLNDALPAERDDQAPAADTLILHEDDWRQFEFVSASFRTLVEDELKAIDAIWREHGVKVGEYTAFKKLHVREKITQPLDLEFSVESFSVLLGGQTVSVALRDSQHTLQDIFGVQGAGVAFYAHIVQGRLLTFGIEPQTGPKLDPAIAERVGRFMTDHQLLLVHWRSRTLIESPEAVVKHLKGRQA